VPGILLLTGPDAPRDAIPRAERSLYAAAAELEHRRFEHASVRGVVSGRTGQVGTVRRGELLVVYEGTPLGAANERAAEAIADLFERDGPAFVRSLNGSFQILIAHGDTVHVFVDHVGSRALFYTSIRGGALACAPEVAPLVALGADASPDPANAVQFLANGRFFAGATVLRGVAQLRPGEQLTWRAGAIERRSWSRYVLSPREDFDAESALAILGATLRRVIIEKFERADRPALLLSGGYDARFIFYTVARHVGDASGLHTVTWGGTPAPADSDVALAADIAARFRTQHSSFERHPRDALASFDEMFAAQSGMTQLALASADEIAISERLHTQLGRRSIFRGDECFGTIAQTDDDCESALRINGLARAPDSLVRRWFVDGGDLWQSAYDHAIAALLADAPRQPLELRDTLYCTERLGSFLQHLTYAKSHHVEVLVPFLDVAVLRLWAGVPAVHRTRKRLFLELFQREFHSELAATPVAARDNGLDWATHLRTDPVVRAFFEDRLEALSHPLDRSYFVELLARWLVHPEEVDHETGIPVHNLLIRAVVLGEWLRRYG
jgi:asparagine synthetase B (glutamine-hydrolysing)